ncbi:MAG: FadR family transcriptional regulator [Chloroflexi bacterium]|nr:MAG: FadR family transcriptional regulator [Chloroflexota bacterium]
MPRFKSQYEFIQYLASANGDENSLPSLAELSTQLDVSVARLREQLEVAKALGFVDVRPRTGIRRLPYSFLPAVSKSLEYSVQVEPGSFEAFHDLRNHIEAAYWDQAVRNLTQEDLDELRTLMERAWEKLKGNPIQIPHAEHRDLHLRLYKRLDNPFVLGLLEAYWDAYEKVGLNLYADYHYLQEVWSYHQMMIDAICLGDYEMGCKALLDHKDLLYFRPDLNLGTKRSS